MAAFITPDFITFLTRCIDAETDPSVRIHLAALIDEWTGREPRVYLDPVWHELKQATARYADKPGFQSRWLT